MDALEDTWPYRQMFILLFPPVSAVIEVSVLPAPVSKKTKTCALAYIVHSIFQREFIED
jgi:hypothetical protein